MPTAVSLDAFADANPRRTGRPCAVCVLPADLREQVDRHLATRRTSRRVISAWCGELGHRVTVGSLNHHVDSGHLGSA